jgi:tRNA 2-selenouridine synthase
MLKSISVEELLDTQGVIVDVRSESEFAEAHVPSAINISLFTDLERVEVGTLYKKKGPEFARRRGLEIVEPKMAQFWSAFAGIFQNAKLQAPTESVLQKAFAQVSEHLIIEEFAEAVRFTAMPDSPALLTQSPEIVDKTLIFYCWRGGARSKSMSLLAHLLGFNARVVVGGHKAFRNHALEFLNSEKYPFKLCTLYGLTGSAKTKILHQWLSEGKPVIDLEALAFHRGSAFGQLGIDRRGRQKDFENNLFWQMQRLSQRGEKLVIVEGESRRIGLCQLPERFMEAMLAGYHVKVEKTVEERVEHILSHYVRPFKEEAVHIEARRALDAIKRKLGGEKHKELSTLLNEKNHGEFTRQLLVHYYDKMYELSRAPADFYHTVIKSADDWDLLPRLL